MVTFDPIIIMISLFSIQIQIVKIPWSSGLGRRLSTERSLVRILVLDTRWNVTEAS